MKTQVFGRGTRRVVIQPGALVTVGGHAVASWVAGHWVPCFKPVHLHAPTVAKALATVFPTLGHDDLQTIGEAFAAAALWADCEEGTNPRPTSQLINTGMGLAAYLAQLQPAAVGAAIERQGLADFGHDLFFDSPRPRGRFLGPERAGRRRRRRRTHGCPAPRAP